MGWGGGHCVLRGLQLGFLNAATPRTQAGLLQHGLAYTHTQATSGAGRSWQQGSPDKRQAANSPPARHRLPCQAHVGCTGELGREHWSPGLASPPRTGTFSRECGSHLKTSQCRHSPEPLCRATSCWSLLQAKVQASPQQPPGQAASYSPQSSSHRVPPKPPPAARWKASLPGQHRTSSFPTSGFRTTPPPPSTGHKTHQQRTRYQQLYFHVNFGSRRSRGGRRREGRC